MAPSHSVLSPQVTASQLPWAAPFCRTQTKPLVQAVWTLQGAPSRPGGSAGGAGGQLEVPALVLGLSYILGPAVFGCLSFKLT